MIYKIKTKRESMQTFNYTDAIYFNTYKKFCEDMDSSRKEILNADKNILRKEINKVDLDTEVYLPNGRFEIDFKQVLFKGFFYYKKGPLYVFLNGAKEPGEKNSLSRWSYYSFLNGSMLNIADPMLDMYPDLKLGWYYGNNEINLRQYVAELVLKIAHIIQVEESDIVFVGSSGGGAATMECASYLKGAKAIAINPQIVLSEYGYASKFTEITKINLEEDKKWHRNNPIHYLLENKESKFFLIVNLRSAADMKQVQNVCAAKKITVKYGLNIFDNLIIWIYDGDMGNYLSAHTTVEYYCIWFVMEYLINNVDKIRDFEDKDAIFQIVNEFWYEHWNQERQWKDRFNCLKTVLGYIKNKKATAIFGLGNKAVSLSKELLELSTNNIFNVKFAIDNDLKKEGTEFQGIPVLHPSNVNNWEELYIIITSDLYTKEIREQLENLGLSYQKDFISYKDIYK